MPGRCDEMAEVPPAPAQRFHVVVRVASPQLVASTITRPTVRIAIVVLPCPDLPPRA